MTTRLTHYWIALRASFWFVPGLMVVSAAVLAASLVALDGSLGPRTPLPEWSYAGGADGARTLLSTVAGSIVTVAGVGFSITIVALVLASTQFGPRLLTLFMRDLVSQVTLGTFTATFTYCILVLRTIRSPDEGREFVPEIAVTGAIALTLVSVAALLYFFHHVAVSIQAPKLVATVARDLDRAIDNLYPRGLGQDGPAPDAGDVPDAETDAVVTADVDGYVQVVDDPALLAAASRHDLVVRLTTRPGLFVVRGNPLLVARPAERVSDAARSELRGTLIIGDVRTPEDDIEFSVRQLVEVALRALSPAINDPFTAMAATDWLAAALARLARETPPSRYRYDAGTLRVIADVSTFSGIVHTVYSRLRHYGASSPVVLNRLLEVIPAFAPHVTDPDDRRLVLEEADAVRRTAHRLLRDEVDLAEVDRRYDAAVESLAASKA